MKEEDQDEQIGKKDLGGNEDNLGDSSPYPLRNLKLL